MKLNISKAIVFGGALSLLAITAQADYAGRADGLQ